MKKFFNYDKKLNHVFFINNHIVLLISKLIIEKYDIKKENIFILSLRNTSTSLINGKSINIKRNLILEKILKKFFLIDLFGLSIKKNLEKLNNKFVLYTPWDIDEVMPILKSKFCLGHCYLEEGQMSFNISYEYEYCKTYREERLRLKEKRISNSQKVGDLTVFKKYFNDSSTKYFAISEDAFPFINKRKKVIFKNFESIKKTYKPALIGIKNLGIFCSPRRFEKKRLEEVLLRLCNYLPLNSCLKLHPEMYMDNFYLKNISLLLNKIDRSDILICESNIIIEAEMLFEKKNLFGPLTSLINYAEMLGSTFKKVNIY